MTSQLFKDSVPNDILLTLLQSCTDTDTDIHYIFGKHSYKKGCINGAVEIFLLRLKEFYFPSKQYYVTRKMSYKNIVTVIRQVCNSKNIPYSTKIVYDSSSYSIIYYIYPELSNVVTNQQFSHNGVAF